MDRTYEAYIGESRAEPGKFVVLRVARWTDAEEVVYKLKEHWPAITIPELGKRVAELNAPLERERLRNAGLLPPEERPVVRRRFGYRIADACDPQTGTLVLEKDPAEFPILERILSSRLVHKRSADDIALWLNAENILNSRGGKWTARSVLHVVDRETLYVDGARPEEGITKEMPDRSRAQLRVADRMRHKLGFLVYTRHASSAETSPAVEAFHEQQRVFCSRAIPRDTPSECVRHMRSAAAPGIFDTHLEKAIVDMRQELCVGVVIVLCSHVTQLTESEDVMEQWIQLRRRKYTRSMDVYFVRERLHVKDDFAEIKLRVRFAAESRDADEPAVSKKSGDANATAAADKVFELINDMTSEQRRALVSMISIMDGLGSGPL